MNDPWHEIMAALEKGMSAAEDVDRYRLNPEKGAYGKQRFIDAMTLLEQLRKTYQQVNSPSVVGIVGNGVGGVAGPAGSVAEVRAALDRADARCA